MIAAFIHRLDPVLVEAGGVYLWWYGLSYTLGLAGLHLWLRAARDRLGLALAEVYRLSLWLAIGVLVGGRAMEVAAYEWPFYSQHPALIPAYWLGGMATHGLLLGALGVAAVYCWRARRSLLPLLDELAIPGAIFMGLGRLGNFVDGQIVGCVTGAWWAVQFPDAAGFRHPVVLYDGLKNLGVAVLLWQIRRHRPRPGMLAAQFLLWYGLPRIVVDLFREYPTTLLGLPTGQWLNLAMALAGAGWWWWLARRPAVTAAIVGGGTATAGPVWGARLALVAVLALATVIPSDWTQDVPSRYGRRHPGLRHSRLYPPLPDRAPRQVSPTGGGVLIQECWPGRNSFQPLFSRTRQDAASRFGESGYHPAVALAEQQASDP